MAVTNKLQHLTYTAIPRGFTRNGDLRVGVRITPRLSYQGSGGTLGDFPDFTRWPVGGFWWSATFDGGATWEPAADEIWVSDGGFWEAAFHTDLEVRPQPIAASAPPPPHPAPRGIRGYSYRSLAQDVGPYNLAPRLDASDLGRRLTRVYFPDRADPLPDSDPLTGFFRFHRPPAPATGPPPRGQLDPDFHQRISMIGDHGPLLERLGLALELRFPPRALPLQLSMAVRLNWETPDGGSAGDHPAPFTVPTRHASPLTLARYESGTVFAVARSASSVSRFDRLLRLDAGSAAGGFSAHDIDVDGTLIGAASASGPDSAPPPPSSAGFHLVLDETAKQADGRLGTGRSAREKMRTGTDDAQGRLRVADLPTLDSDHLLQGYEIEVKHLEESGAPWRGLCHREVTYTAFAASGHEVSFTARGIAPVVTGFRKVDDTSQDADLETSDVLARWDGWSLAVHRPGVYELQSDASTGETVTAPGQFPTGTIDIATRLPDGDQYRLPPLRFGHRYQFRLRAVDVTGFAHDWAGALPSAEKTYRRYDPVPAPLVLSPSTLTRTENARRLVVRTGDFVEDVVSSFRTLVPPRTSVETAMTHGMLDKDGAPDPDAWGQIGDLDAAMPATEAVADPGAPGTPQPMAVEWLPDPTCVRVGVGMPNRTGPFTLASFVPRPDDADGKLHLGAWQSVAIRLDPVDTPGREEILAVVEENGHRVVPVELGPGETTTIEVRGLPPHTRLGELGLVADSPALKAELDPSPVNGELIDRLCPPVELTLVHAVPQPLTSPKLSTTSQSLRFERDFDKLAADVFCRIDHDAKTTGRLTVYAHWSEWQDLGPAAPRRAAPRLVDVAGTECGDATTGPSPTLVRGRLVLPDRRRRNVTLFATATGRYVEEFRRTLDDIGFANVADVGWLLDLPQEVEVESVRLLRSDRDLERTTDYEVVIDPRTERRTLRLVDGSIRSEVVVLGVPGAVTRTALLGTDVVPASMRPLAPEVEYVVPAFETDVDHLGGGTGHSVATRGKPRIRIWLERPWWSSGDEEKLAVIWRMDRPPPVDPSTGDYPAWYSDSDRLSKLVTMVAQDPTENPGPFESGSPDEHWKRMQPQPITGVAHPDPIVLDEGLDEPVSVQVQLHDVTYDEDRDMYYAEVGWDDEQYGMFVRLAVARFQEFVNDEHSQLSRIRTIDPVQLWPSRTATARNVSNQDGPQVEVEVTAPEQTHRRPHYLQVSIQKRVHAGDDHLGWDTVSTNSAEDVTSAVRLPRPPAGGKFRLLVEEFERWPSRRANGAEAGPSYTKVPSTLTSATEDLVGLRPVWVTTLPLPVN